MSNPERAAVSAAEKIIDNLEDRSGFDHWWGGIDAEVQREIQLEIASIIQDAIQQGKESHE